MNDQQYTLVKNNSSISLGSYEECLCDIKEKFNDPLREINERNNKGEANKYQIFFYDGFASLCPESREYYPAIDNRF